MVLARDAAALILSDDAAGLGLRTESNARRFYGLDAR
jgi:hypothetical protein